MYTSLQTNSLNYVIIIEQQLDVKWQEKTQEIHPHTFLN